VALLAFFWIGCESQLISTDWEGEYEMKTQVIVVYQDNTKDTIRTDLQTPVSIYKDKGKLFVSTFFLGMPNYDCEEPITLIKLPQRIQCKLDSVEDVVVNTSPIVVMNDGLIYTITNGVILGSKPILIKGCTLNSITFSRSEVFDVLMVNQEGDAKDNIACYFDYKSINKVEDIFTYYTWEVNLIFENTPFISFENQGIAGIKYHNILRKK
jgi:hypothetical protein